MNPLPTRHFRSLTAATLVLIIVSAGCNVVGGGGSGMTYEQAASGLKKLIDDALIAGFAGAPLPPPEPVIEDFCVDSHGVVNDEVHPYYDYFFPIQLLGDDPDSFVFRAAESLAAAGLRVTVSDDPGVTARFATDENFGLEVLVNYVSGEASIGGTGPCVKPPKDRP